jgi:FkbM family methyltransferase
MLVMQNELDDIGASRALVQGLLAEGVAAARERERHTFDELAGQVGDSIVLFGAGGLGRRCLAGLRRYGREPQAFADSNPRLWNAEIDGLRVLPPAEAAKRFSKTSVFVITIWGARGSDRMTDRVSALRSLGCETVMPFGPLFWRYPDGVLPHYAVDLPHGVIEQSTDVLKGFELWADAASRREYVAQLRWRLSFDFDGLGPPALETIYFPPDLVRLQADELFVDGGAFDGDTLREFLIASNGSFEKYIAFEPDPRNFARLSDSLTSLPEAVRQRIEIYRAAIAAEDGTARFSAEGGPSSHVGEGDLEVEAVALDRYLGTLRPTFIKMDIEGAEPEALAGVNRHIREDAPILAISCYHRQDHLWAIPLLINSINSQYAFYLRPHDLEGWDLVCYAIPRSRLPLEGQNHRGRR